MSYNRNLHNFRGKSTFHNTPFFVPPPPTPPAFYLPPPKQLTDQDIVKQFENKLSNVHSKKPQTPISISKVRDEIRNLVLALNEIKMKEKMLSEKLNDLSDDEWSSYMKRVEENKAVISEILSNINNLNTEVLRKLLAKRASKRTRQKQQRLEKKREKEERMKEIKEKSRKIDEYLQKFQDDMNRAKQEEESKLQADAVLKETIRKKQDAKKYIVKLDALVKLRRARQNSAKGRGESMSEREGEIFEKNIEKLKSMWTQGLKIYKNEETELRSQLMQDSAMDIKKNDTELEVTESLVQWKDALFGGLLPQQDFGGNVDRFVAVRSQWDHYLSSEGTSIPVGWVPPTAKK